MNDFPLAPGTSGLPPASRPRDPRSFGPTRQVAPRFGRFAAFAAIVFALGCSASKQPGASHDTGGDTGSATGDTSTGGTSGSTSSSTTSSSSDSGTGTTGDFILPITSGGGGSTGPRDGGVVTDDPPHANVPSSLVVSVPGDPPLPTDPSTSFTGTPDDTRAPSIVYPNDGVMLPANLKRLEVHFMPGSASNTLFQIDFSSDRGHVQIYLRCTNPTNGGCIYELDPDAYASVAETNRGGGPITVRVRGTDDAGTGFGESAPISISFSENYVLGGIYYWTTSQGSGIMRYDFGGTQATPEVFMSPMTSGLSRCVGCHALSRDGKKIVASLGGQNDGALVYLNDLSQSDMFTLKDDTDDRAQFASFNPTGDRFVSIYGDTNNADDRNTLWFNDGTTGKRIASESIVLPFEPDHPDWSPDGNTIAVTRVGIHQTSQRPFDCGIELIPRMGDTWGPPATLVPESPGLSRFNPSFSPDSSFLLYTESTCPNGSQRSNQCDGDADPSAKTWAVLAQPGATPILLAKAGAPGVADAGATNLADTFPRFTPFMQANGTRLMWATISSRRKPGLRPLGTNQNGDPDQLLWMFAISPDAVQAGQDGSYPAFFLPFQDLTTSNHIAQWTKAVVGKPIHVN